MVAALFDVSDRVSTTRSRMTLASDSLYFKAGSREILRHVSFEWRTGLLVIYGSNGSGKSTLLKCLSSSMRPSAGMIRWDGIPIDDRLADYRRSLGYAPQGRHFRSELRAVEFLEACATLRQLKARSMRSEILHVLGLVGLEDYVDVRLESLSGGSLRKLLTAQALMGKPKLVLLDEPTAEVDAAGSALIWNTLKEYARDASVIVATHDLELALSQADGCARMEQGCLSPIEVPDNA